MTWIGCMGACHKGRRGRQGGAGQNETPGYVRLDGPRPLGAPPRPGAVMRLWLELTLWPRLIGTPAMPDMPMPPTSFGSFPG